MKTILTEKPSVAREIARIVGATKREEGYFEGGGYAITWAFGHLVQPALPENYGVRGFCRESLPFIPNPFLLVPRQVKTEKGYKPDGSVMKQIQLITRLFGESERIIVATDAGREGELIFRNLYHHLNCDVPFERLWISSLTEKAIREGLKKLRSGSDCNNLYLAAKARSEADYLIGINGTQAVTLAAGRGTYSVGRVQTPTLAMLCKRYWENKRFIPETFWQLHIGTHGCDSEAVKFSSVEKWQQKVTAEELYQKLQNCPSATVTYIERNQRTEEAPLLYDLTTLQKEANIKHGFTAEQTLEIAQKLYEKKLITYPRTGSRYISEDVFAEIPRLLQFLKKCPILGDYASTLKKPSRRSVNDTGVTDHHALLITGENPLHLSREETLLYDMVARRMLEAFSEACVKDVTAVTTECAGVEFTIKGSVIRQAGWRNLSGEEKKEPALPDWKEGDTIPVKAVSITEGTTRAKPLHTEATLLAAMETAGKEIEDDALRQAMKDCGIGTPATRAAIIETLFARGYVERHQKSLVPTEKGLALYSVVKDMRIADVSMTGEWESALAKIEQGEMSPDTFREAVEVYTRQITSELLSSEKLFGHKVSDCLCPKCRTGKIQFFGTFVRCNHPDCGLTVFRQKAQRLLSDTEMTDLLIKGKTKLLKDFKSKQGKPFEATVAFDKDFNTQFIFPEKKKTSSTPGQRK